MGFAPSTPEIDSQVADPVAPAAIALCGLAADTLTLDACLGPDQATPLHEALLRRRGAPLAVDASQVERIGALCFQVLASARRTWAADGRPLHFETPSPAFTAGLSLMGGSDWAHAPQEDRLP